MQFYAHSRAGAAEEFWEPLEDHLRLTAEGDVVNLSAEAHSAVFTGSAGFAAAFGAEAWGRLLGWWHDLGKYSIEFQDRLRLANGLEAHLEGRPGKVDHATAGARAAVECFGPIVGKLLAYCITGHHGGMLDGVGRDGHTGLKERLEKNLPATHVPDQILGVQKPPLPPLDFGKDRDAAFRLSVFCRMLFSCLVDADYLATESFMKPERAARRDRTWPAPAELSAILDRYMDSLQASAKDTVVNHKRREVLEECRRKAEMPPGFFSLTVPTGGGKTYSSLAFALRHATRYGLHRVIYAIPFTSIIEQNAEKFREALTDAGPDVVLEHHSNLEDEEDGETVWGRLAAENWDAPLIVTTNVQLYESLFANKPSRCRKLHNVAKSVIVLDEVQTLPVRLLRPTLAMLEELVRNYGCSIVLCSATQPAVQERENFKIGLRDVREIVEDAGGLFDALRRVQIEWLGSIAEDALIERLQTHKRVLCVVNTRAQAARLYEALKRQGGEGVFHLSTMMCPKHRKAKLAEIKNRLDPERSDRPPCRVISTQLIEAGVDVDFPVVYRALAGLDSIAQAAGRCNREGRLTGMGEVYVFEGEIPKLMSDVRTGADKTREVRELHADVMTLEAIEAYFRLFYWQRQGEWDKPGGDARPIMDCFSFAKTGPHFQFREVAESYKLIDDKQTSVIVPYGEEGKRFVEELTSAADGPSRSLSRRLQPYSVGVYAHQLRELIENQVIAQYHEQYWVLENHKSYDDEMGLRLDVSGLDPETLVC